ITTDPYFASGSKVPEILQKKLPDLHKEALQKNNKQIVDKLKTLIAEYPEVPVLKNYLSVAYVTQDRDEEARKVNKQILVQHPDYLYAKLNEAHFYLNKDMPEKVPEVLGKDMELKALYPHRNTFHFKEVTAFFNLAIRYFCAIGNLEQAQIRLDILEKIAPDEPETENAADMVEYLKLSETLEQIIKKSPKNRKAPVRPVSVKDTKMPKFHHEVTRELYKYGFDLPHEILQKILALPRKTLIEDLEMVLEDGLKRYDYFASYENVHEKTAFVLHALYLLTELKATESLPKVLDLFTHDEEMLEFWLENHLAESLWQCIFTLGADQFGLLKQFLLTPDLYLFAKGVVLQGLEQLVFHKPEKREEIGTLYAEVLNHYLALPQDDPQQDPEFNGFLVNSIILGKISELKPQIKQLFEKDIIVEDINGNFEAVESELEEPSPVPGKNKILPIEQLYEEFETWYDDDLDFDEGFDIDAKLDEILKPRSSFESIEPVKRTEPKVGRNDPCPCGSSKKYKKCCGND
ncbi:MAG TPA: DUF1186 domain-containing protein, partial [Adhaeribacter sp.]|nr:DUF1186 domain-containing protein [Adhaeribacter sp.]